ncbi:hypothetical protein EWH23_13735 [Meiothermus sp. PNK-Is4]|uniref:hypothetical protein n=1 Tax=Meiothermus sp. PNK-Is4 TaxID=2740565 RepID=UPI000D7C7FB7|nr:hypothetical protein [Meiothermus sp. PNK-Is4]PZA06815.1 hypothetical protein DNA98_11410 [Meiothermus sp. Pnk-1]RYM33096.1 hypothetical protein EWH23_13735 [Meiothermus sp. PNK-Is4]
MVFVGVLDSYPSELVMLYEQILVWGMLFYIVGIVIGFYTPLLKIMPLRHTLNASTKELLRFVAPRVLWITLMALAGVMVSFAVMGFIPMFAEDPLMAKFFRGPYQEAYRPVAPLYRASMFLLYLLIPLNLVLWFHMSKKRFLLLALLSFAVIAASLVRGQAIYGFLIFVGLLAARNRVGFLLFLVFVVAVYPLGSASYYLLKAVFGLDALGGVYQDTGIWQIIASGAPDISDQLTFLAAFIERGSYTYGLTFVGGLVPYNFTWSPAVWVLALVNPGTSVSEIASGGFRLAVPLWGYASFGWVGVIIVPLISGFIWGNATRYAKKYVENPSSLLHAALALTVYLTIGVQLSQFYLLSMYSLPGIALALFLLYRFKWFARAKLNAYRGYGHSG